MNVGDRVLKEMGDYRYAGVIVAKFTKLSGAVRYVVEHEELHILFIFNNEQLRLADGEARMTKYPILVERYKGDQSTIIVCLSCGANMQAEPEQLNNDGLYRCSCGGEATYKYEEAMRCPSCRKLGHWDAYPLDGCCSRVCQLQHKYAMQRGQNQ